MLDFKTITLRCEDNVEAVVFTKYDDGDIDISIEDSYLGKGNYVGIIGRFKRAWHAFLEKPIVHSSVFRPAEKKELVKKWLEDCLALVNEEVKQDG